MEESRKHFIERVWLVAPIGGVIFFRLIRDLTVKGGLLPNLGNEILLIVGWVLGQLLTEMDHVFYASVCNPQELTCQRVKKEMDAKNWRNAWGLLQATKAERTRLPIRNMLTVAVILGLAIWVISSSRSYMAMGVVLGLSIRLLSEALAEQDYKKWYWLIKRDFSQTEHRGFLVAWIIVVAWELLRIILF